MNIVDTIRTGGANPEAFAPPWGYRRLGIAVVIEDDLGERSAHHMGRHHQQHFHDLLLSLV